MTETGTGSTRIGPPALLLCSLSLLHLLSVRSSVVALSSKVHNVLKPLACVVPVPTASSRQRLMLTLMETVESNKKTESPWELSMEPVS